MEPRATQRATRMERLGWSDSVAAKGNSEGDSESRTERLGRSQVTRTQPVGMQSRRQSLVCEDDVSVVKTLSSVTIIRPSRP